MPGDLLLVNGPVVTMDPARPAASAIAVGSDAEACVVAGPGVETIDLRGRTATPDLSG